MTDPELVPRPIPVHRQPVAMEGTVVNTVQGPPGLVAVPCVDWLWTAAACALLRLILGLPNGSRYVFNVATTTLAGKRNWCVNTFLDHPELEWLLFVDSDQTPPDDAAARLLAWDVPVVGAPVVARRPPYALYAGYFRNRDLSWDRLTIGPDTPPLAPVDFCGTGCVLVRRNVLATIDPWPFTPGEDGDSEDRRFFWMVRQAGIPVYVDTTLRVGHLAVQSLVLPDPHQPVSG